MTATTLDSRTLPRLSGGGLLRSEWIKLRSLRSTVWSYLILVVAFLGMAALMGSSLRYTAEGTIPAEQQLHFLAMASTFGVFFGQLIVAVLGVLVISGEYSTGMIRSTLTAVPRRLPALVAKAVVLFVTTFVVGLVSSIGAYLVASPILASQGIHGSLFEPELLKAIVGGALYLGLVSLFALGVGFVLRSSAGGISAALGVLLILPVIFQLIPAKWAHDVLPYLLSNAGQNMFGLTASPAAPGALEGWQNLLVVLAWVVVSIVTGAILLKRRDA
jgi:ABC-2 type transport system permease protein